MYLNRRFSLPTQGAIEFLLGMLTMLAPVVFVFGAAGLVVSFALGAVLAGTGLALSTGRPGVAHALHNQFDGAFLLVAATAAFGLAVAGQTVATIFLAALVGVLACLTYSTRYVTAG